MRYKFRGKRVDTGDWVVGYLFGVNAILKLDSTYTVTSMGTIVHGMVEAIPESVGQFTGLLDKNGVEIYEGDVVETLVTGYTFVVEFKHGCFGGNWDGFTPMLESIYGEGGIVISNIHDNPELMEVE